jgi:hypothetical protein
LITGGSWTKVSKTITTEFSVDGMTDRKSGAAGRPTVRQCPLPRFREQVALRCGLSWCAGARLARRGGCWQDAWNSRCVVLLWFPSLFHVCWILKSPILSG